MYWFAAQHQTSTFTRQKFGLFFFFSKQQEGVEKMAKTKVVQKNANSRRSETKG